MCCTYIRNAKKVKETNFVNGVLNSMQRSFNTVLHVCAACPWPEKKVKSKRTQRNLYFFVSEQKIWTRDIVNKNSLEMHEIFVLSKLFNF